MIIIGDFNIDLIQSDHDKNTSDFLNIMFSSCYKPLVTKPTRITSHNATIIDNIFVNMNSNINASGLIYKDIPDHLPIFAILNVHKGYDSSKSLKARHIFSRVITQQSMHKMRIKFFNYC